MVITKGFGQGKKIGSKRDMDRIVDYVTEAIKKKLKEKDWSQRDLAKKIGKTEAWVSRKIGDDIKTKRRITIDDLSLIARGLDAFPSDFLPKRLDEEICHLPLVEFIRLLCQNEMVKILEENGIIVKKGQTDNLD